MIKFLSDILQSIPSRVFYFFINPASLLGVSFSIISYSINSEKLVEFFNFSLFSLNGALNYQNGMDLGSLIHSNLNDFFLIPAIFVGGLFVIYYRRLKQFSDLDERTRQTKAISLTMFEGSILSGVLFVGVMLNIYYMFGDNSLNTVVLISISGLTLGINCSKGIFAEKSESFIENMKLKKNHKK